MPIELKRKLILSEGEWKLFAYYSAGNFDRAELDKYEGAIHQSVYFLMSKEDIDNVKEQIPEAIREAALALFK